jgi:hypothetical protein
MFRKKVRMFNIIALLVSALIIFYSHAFAQFSNSTLQDLKSYNQYFQYNYWMNLSTFPSARTKEAANGLSTWTRLFNSNSSSTNFSLSSLMNKTYSTGTTNLWTINSSNQYGNLNWQTGQSILGLNTWGNYTNRNTYTYRFDPSSIYNLKYSLYPFYYSNKGQEGCSCLVKDLQEASETQGLMLLIEFEGTDGLNNFVYELQKRDIPSLLIVTADFVTENCTNIRKLQRYGVEIGGVYPQKPLWDVPYEEQYAAMRETKETIEACTGKPMRVFGSRYFAYDENTVIAAESLGIPFVLARGTTGARATIYQPEEYNVKIFSVSNVSSEKWGTGSLCDYSYWAREGSPEEFGDELFAALKHDKISPVSHTYIGGLKAAWNTEYLNFFDNAEVTWVDLDTFGNIDITQPFSEIPDNREVQYTTPKPLIPLDDESNVDNPCSINDFPPVAGLGGDVGEKIVVFHNGTGPMCLNFLDFADTLDYPVEEHLTSDEGFWDDFNALKAEYGSSEGISENFGYFPVIYIRDKAYSGFNNEIMEAIISIISE